MLEDRVALSNSSYEVTDMECPECGKDSEIEVEKEYKNATKETIWWGKFLCQHCGHSEDAEGWY